MTSDLLMLQEFGESRTPPTDQPPPDLRRRVLTATLAGPPRGRRTAVRPAGLRLAWRVGALGGVAAALTAAVLLVVPNLHTAGNAPPPDTQAAAPDAVRLLTLAAQHSAAAPELSARPDQFLFVESVDVVKLLGPGQPPQTLGPTLSQHWDSVDGTRDGTSRSRPLGSTGDWRPAELMPGCRGGRSTPTRDRPGHTEACTPWPAFRSGLPTDADAMLAHLYRPGTDDRDIATTPDLPADQKAFHRFTDIIEMSHHSPAVQAAAFRAAMKIPGVTVVRDAVDVTGRRGIAVARDANGLRAELIFDPTTYAHLGTNYDHDLTAGPGEWTVTVPLRQAILRVAIVDRAGQVP